MIFAVLLALVLVLLIVVYRLSKRQMSYWRKRGVKQGDPVVLIGDLWRTFLRLDTIVDMVNNLYKMFPNERYSGFYQFSKPTLIIRDPELVKLITVKDFDHFTDHAQLFPEEENALWSRNLFALKGKAWRDMRVKLTPSFTSSKIKFMFGLMDETARNFVKYFQELESEEGKIEVELKDVFTRFTNDVIASTAFGVQVDSLKDKENEFYLMGKRVTDLTGFAKSAKFILQFMMPRLSKALNLSFFDKDVNDFFIALTKETIKIREEQNIIRPDMIHLLMEARKGTLRPDDLDSNTSEGFATTKDPESSPKTESKIEISDLDIAAQALVFFFAGFDSVAASMAFMGYELAVNPEVQSRLRQEIQEVHKECQGKLTYDTLIKMKYLDAVVSETLRKWPNAVAIDHVCTKPYTIKAVEDHEVDVDIHLNQSVWISVYGLHHDPKYYPDPERFNPDRFFGDENKSKIVPYTYLPFGVGPRNCIGSRFAILEMKVVFYHLLHSFKIVPSKKSTIPLKISKKLFSLTAEDGYWFDFERV